MAFLTEAANRGSIATGYDIENSLKFESDNTESLTKSQTSSNRKTWTLSLWFKRTKIDTSLQYVYHWNVSSGNEFYIMFNGDADWRVEEYSSGRKLAFHSAQKPLNDPSAWYHLVLACDTTQSTSTDRFKIYLNGVQVNAISGYFSTAQYPTQNYDTHINNSAATISIAKSISASTNFCGYMAEVNFVDGQALAATDFGKFHSASNIWQPIEYTGSYGNEGYFLNFQDSANLGDDASGNAKNFTENNITSADQATDTPTNNFCTWNPLWAYPNTATVGNGGTSSIGGAAAVWRGSKGTIGLTNGKWYWEQKANGNDTIVGWQTENVISVTGTNAHNVNDTIALYEAGNYIWLRDETSGRNDTAASGSYANGQIVGFALDLDSSPQTATFYRNGSAIASNVNIDGLTGKTIFPFTSHYQQTSNANFGGYTNISDAHTNTDENGYGAFVYTPPSGYYAICTKNLAEYG